MPRANEAQILSRYASGDVVRAIADEEHVSVQTIYDVLERNGARTRKGATDKDRFIEIVKVQGVARAAEACGISTSTGNRILRDARERGVVVDVRKGRPPAGTPEDIAFRRLWKSSFPYPVVLDEEQTRIEINKLRLVTGFLDGDVIRPKSNAGIRLCRPFFPNRYEAQSGSNASAVTAWSDEKALRRAIRLQITHEDPTTPERVLRAITLGCRTPTIFRPAVAKFICERYAHRGDTVWDPCAGYGGRLLGATAAGVRYIGTDVDEVTVNGNRCLAEAAKLSAEVTLCPAENFDPPRGVPLVFTSPPYFDRERYSDAPGQSWRKYRTICEWIDRFLRPVVGKAWECLRTGGHLVINVADIRTRAKRVPIVSETVSAAVDSGFRHVETLRMPISGINRKAPFEPVLVFQK